MAMEGVFLFVFGMVVGLALFPHLQNLADQARSRLSKLDRSDQAKGPSPWS
jgi:hypothetical protein